MKYLERVYPWLLVAPAILPVVIWGGLIYPYLVPKTLLFYALSILAIGAFAMLATHGRAFYWARVKKWETWVPAALLVLAYVASVFGVGFSRSFWSIFARGDGLLMLTGAVASYYLILLAVDGAFFTRFVRVVATVGSFVAVYGIGEWLVSGGGRIGGLLGNAAFFAGYLGLALFATLMAAPMLSRGWRRAAYIGAGAEVVAIALSATRGTMLALGVAGVVWLIYQALGRPAPADASAGALRAARPSLTPAETSAGFGLTPARARVILAVIVVLGGLFVAFRSELAQVPFQPIARVASISTADPDVASRLFIWQNMLGQIKQHLWLGVGAEHIDVLFNHFYDPTQITEQWFDRSHNAFLDYAAQYGIGGLLLYLALIAGFFTAARRYAARGDRRLALLAALAGLVYAVQNFFVFDTISSFWLFLALLALLTAGSLDAREAQAVPLPAWMQPASYAFTFVLVALLYPVAVRPCMAAYDLAHAYSYQVTDVARSADLLAQGFALSSVGAPDYGYTAYEMYTGAQTTGQYALTGADRVTAYRAALAVLEADFARYPYDARIALDLAHLLTIDPSGTVPDHALLSAALDKVLALSPKRSQAWYILANLSISAANAQPKGSAARTRGYAAAKDLLGRYSALVPRLAEPYFVLAQLDYATGDTAGAAAAAARGKQYYAGNLETASRAAVYYETARDLPDAAFFLKEVVRMDPGNTAAANDLATIEAYEQAHP